MLVNLTAVYALDQPMKPEIERLGFATPRCLSRVALKPGVAWPSLPKLSAPRPIPI